MILLTGAGGKTGRTLLKSLSRDEKVCAFIHHEGQVEVMKSLGATKVVIGDLRDAGAIRAAMEGSRAVYHICPNMSPYESEIGQFVLDAARRVSVEHFVYHSVLHPQVEKMNHHWQKMRVEEQIFETGVPFTILQPAPYMQNLLADWNEIIQAGILRVPYSIDTKFSFVELADVAEAARIVLTEPGHKHATYELAGTPPLSHLDAANMLGELLKKTVRAETEPVRDWKLRAEQAGLSEYAVENLVAMFEYYDKWGLTGNPSVLGWILKRSPTSLKSFLAQTLSER